MKYPNDCKLGIMFRREHAPEKLPEFALRTEQAGFDELWVVEDSFYSSGIASASTALACTTNLTVGLGIMPAVARNPVFSAMEIATLARIFPGRFLPGIGHGVAEWMRQIGAFPKSQLKALEEVTLTTRRLLAGEHFSFDGGHIQLDQVHLVHPPRVVPPVSLGVIGPKSLALSGQVADGTILSEYSNPAYVSWAKEHINIGKKENAQDRQHRLTIFAFACAADCTDKAHQKLRPMVAEAVASGGLNPKLEPMGILPETRQILENGGLQGLAAEMPGDWIDQITIAGTPQDWRAAVTRFAALGAHSVVLVPLPDADVDEIENFAQHLK